MDKLIVIKIGGNLIDDPAALLPFLQDLTGLPERKILVHGGGKLATDLAAKLELPQQMVAGRRITDMETLKVVTMVYAGYINKTIVAALQGLGANAVGFSGADGNAIRAHRRRGDIDFGWVGDVDEVNTDFLTSLLELNCLPVLAPITHDGSGQLLNTNADTIAQEVATALSRQFEVELIYCFEKEGVLLQADDESSLIPLLNQRYYEELKQQGTIFAGMIPKLDNAFDALGRGVKSVLIGKGAKLRELHEGRTGTRISHEL